MILRSVAFLLALAAPVAAAERSAGRARVLDGDTLAVGGIRIRPKGVAAPETAEPGGIEAKAFMVELIEGQMMVRATSPASAPTAPGRLLL